MAQNHTTLVAALLALGLVVPTFASAHDDDHGGGDDRYGGRDYGHEQDHHDYDHDDRGGNDGYRGVGLLTVRNDFDGETQVFVDSRFVGIIGGDRTGSFQVSSGCHDVLVSRPGTNFVLSQTRFEVYGGTTFLLPVYAPTSMLRLSNTGEVTLKVQVGSASAWVSPGNTVQVPVTTGNASLVASIKDPQGEWKALEKTLWVEPGQVAFQTLHPDPTVVIVTNHDRISVRALVDGVDEGYVAPGASKRVWVKPGNTTVLLLDSAGRVRSNTTVVVARGREGRVVYEPRYNAVGAVMTVDLGRPGSPVRATGEWSYR